MKNCIIYDFDGTITKTDSTKYLLLSILARHPYKFLILLIDILIILVHVDSNKIQNSKNKLIGKLFRNLTEKEIIKSLDLYKKKVQRSYRKNLLKKINYEINNDSIVLIITASPRVVIENLFINSSITVIGTEFEMIDKKFTGNLLGNPCHGEHKVNAYKNWLQSQKYELKLIEAWSDSLTDLSLLRLARKRFWIGDQKSLDKIKKIDKSAEFKID